MELTALFGQPQLCAGGSICRVSTEARQEASLWNRENLLQSCKESFHNEHFIPAQTQDV